MQYNHTYTQCQRLMGRKGKREGMNVLLRLLDLLCPTVIIIVIAIPLSCLPSTQCANAGDSYNCLWKIRKFFCSSLI